MHYPFLVAAPQTGQHHRLTASRLAELALAPQASQPPAWQPARAVHAQAGMPWAQSLLAAPDETLEAVSQALEDLVLATPNLRPPAEAVLAGLADSRAKQHLGALVALWKQMGEALPDGLAPVRHVLELPHGRFLQPLPVVEGSLDPLAPAAMKALYQRLKDEFGSVPSAEFIRPARPGSRLHALQAGLSVASAEALPADDSLFVTALRDVAACAEFAAARARALIETGVAAADIAVLHGGDSGFLEQAFVAQGVPLFGLPVEGATRDVIGEAAYYLVLAKRWPCPPMVLASLACSPLMPWPAQFGRRLAEAVMKGRGTAALFEAAAAAGGADHAGFWQLVRSSAYSGAQLRLLIEDICAVLPEGRAIHARIKLPAARSALGAQEWETLLRNVDFVAAAEPEPLRLRDGVSLWPARQKPWRSCRHLIICDFHEGLYPFQPAANPLFLDSEIAAINAATGLSLGGRKRHLARSLALFDEQLQACSDSVDLLIPRRDLAGKPLAPASGLALISRFCAGIAKPEELVESLSPALLEKRRIPFHRLEALPTAATLPKAVKLRGHDLFALRHSKEGKPLPQSPSRLEVLLVSPLAWLLGELDAEGLDWEAQTLDALLKGKLAHAVFEQVFDPASMPADAAEAQQAVPPALNAAIKRRAAFLDDAEWDLERSTLLQEIQTAAGQWQRWLEQLEATAVVNEQLLHGKFHELDVHGIADAVLALPDGTGLLVDYKRGGATNRIKRMENGWDQQLALYCELFAQSGEESEAIIDQVLCQRLPATAYFIMNGGQLLASGLTPPSGGGGRDLGTEVSEAALAELRKQIDAVRGGEIRLNSTADANTFANKRGIAPYPLNDGPLLVRKFLRPVEEQEEA